MEALTPEQEAARAVGMSHGVPEEFAIDCKGIALSNIVIGKVTFLKGDQNVKLYDKRQRDYLRSHRLFIATHDVFLVTKKPVPATIASVTVNTEDNHGTQSSSEGDAQTDTLTLPDETGGGKGSTAARRTRSRRGTGSRS